jgi:hemoglobin
MIGKSLKSYLWVAVALLAMIGSSSVVAQEKSLYDRLGGAYAISGVVDDFIDRVLVNETLNANPAIDEARHRVPRAGLKFMVTLMMCDVTGGPEKYTGRTMLATHAHLNITENEWTAMMADFKASLDKFKVPAKEQGELMDLMNSTKADIVTKP